MVRAIAAVADACKLDEGTQRTFRRAGAIAYDAWILRWYTDRQKVSIWTFVGRLHLPYPCGEDQRRLLQSRQGQADLVYRDGAFYLHQTCDIDPHEPRDPDGWLGVDLGIVNLAVDSEGETFSGAQIEARRRW